MVEFNEIFKRILILTEIVYHIKNKKSLMNKLIKERYSEFHDLEKIINSNNLIHKYKTEGIIPKNFSNYQNPIDLFKNLSDGNINPKEVLKKQFNFKLDLGEIKKRKKNEIQI